MGVEPASPCCAPGWSMRQSKPACGQAGPEAYSADTQRRQHALFTTARLTWPCAPPWPCCPVPCPGPAPHTMARQRQERSAKLKRGGSCSGRECAGGSSLTIPHQAAHLPATHCAGVPPSNMQSAAATASINQGPARAAQLACMTLKSATARSHCPPFSQALMSEVKM